MSGCELSVVACTPRAGHSWLSSLLAQHPQLRVFNHDTRDNHLLYALHPIRSINPWSDDRPRTASRLDGRLDTFRVRALQRWRRGVSDGRKPVLVTSTAVAYLDHLIAAFPRLRIVHLTRDPLDVVASFHRFAKGRGNRSPHDRYRQFRSSGRGVSLRHAVAHGIHTWRWQRWPYRGYLVTRPPGFQEASRLPPFEFYAWYYLWYEHAINRALSGVPEAQRCAISYERLVTTHHSEMGELLRFLDVGADEPFLRHTAGTVRSSSIGRHRVELSEEEKAAVKEAISAGEVFRPHPSASGTARGPD